MNDRPLVLYHANCADGFGAALAAYLRFGDGAEYTPVQYGQVPPDATGRDLYLLDFSFKYPELTKLAGQARRLAVCDHHKTAEEEVWRLCEESDGRVEVYFDVKKSGAVLAWEFFHDDEVPELFLYLQDRDLWRWEMPDSREVSAAIQSHPFDLKRWHVWLESWPNTKEDFVTEGRAILRYQDRLVGDHVGHAREAEIAGHRVLAVNATCLVSEVAGRLAEGRPFGVCYFRTEDGKWVWSLRSRDGGVDVSEVAKALGGGGHPRAAGCTRDTPP